MVPLKDLFRNKLLLQENFHTNEVSMDEWPFWMFEENIKMVNEIIEEEESDKKKQEGEQSKGMPNFDANSMMKSASNFSSNIPKL